MRVGLELLVNDISSLRGKYIGVITNHTGVLSNFVHVIDLFLKFHLNVRVIFAPEHGFRGDVLEGSSVRSYVDERTGLPVVSLYGRSYSPPEDILRKLDVVIYDIQDVGARFYTYISTLFYVLESAGKVDVEVFVLDRPNPITGLYVEGPILEPGYRSFVGIWYIPVRYGMTVGELALLFNEEADLGADLRVVKMEGWCRRMWFDETGLPWVPPSPNMPSLDTAVVYPGTCLIEGTNVSEGRGTTKPFELIGAPWIDEYELVDELRSLPIGEVKYRPATFTPWRGKYSGEVCRGVQVYVVDRDVFEPVKLGLGLVWTIKRLYPDKFEFIKRGNRYYFDLLIGCDDARKLIEGGCDFDDLVDLCKRGLDSFNKVRGKYLLYH